MVISVVVSSVVGEVTTTVVLSNIADVVSTGSNVVDAGAVDVATFSVDVVDDPNVAVLVDALSVVILDVPKVASSVVGEVDTPDVCSNVVLSCNVVKGMVEGTILVVSVWVDAVDNKSSKKRRSV